MEPKLKKARTAAVPDAAGGDIINRALTAPASVKSYKEEYANALPYPHVTFTPFCDELKFEGVRDEILTNLNVKYKETDLFKLYQTQDLANIKRSSHPELAAKLPHLLALRDSLYSKDFRAFISSITGCPELTERVDMAASAYSNGCHLLAHDDVIGTRAVSFIIYFCAKDWSDSDGGALELYPLEPSSILVNPDSRLPQGVPNPNPSKSILPKWNSMAIFNVEPGRSYHSVQEVTRDGSPRLSIQGWYHAPHPPKGAEMASLNQLKSIAMAKNCESTQVGASAPGGGVDDQADWELTEEDMALLSAWVNPMYLQEKSMGDIEKRMQEDSNLELRSFLKADVAERIREACAGAENCAGGIVQPKGWTLVGPAHVQRFLRCGAEQPVVAGKSAMSEATSLLKRLKSELFVTKAFRKLVHKLTGESRPSQNGFSTEIRHFRRGRDYTVAHHGMLLKEGESVLDVTLCFVDDKSEETEDTAGAGGSSGTAEDEPQLNEKAAAWDYGENGGFDCYIAAEDEANEAAEVYDDSTANDPNDDGGILLSVSPSFNTLSVALRDEGTMRFIKYVSKNAPSGWWDVATSFGVNYDEGDSDDDGNDT